MPEQDLQVTERVIIPGAELSFRFSRAGGAGGQNVNKVNSRAELLWDVAASDALPPAVKERFTRLARRYLTAAGEVQIASHVHREQGRNQERCRERLRELIAEALVPPTERRATRPTQASRRRRLAEKKARGDIKRGRSSRPGDDA